jgi:solute:Na+ symporter, SSS family
LKVVVTIAFRALNVADGKDETHPTDCRADAGDPGVKDPSELLDEGPEPARS